MDTNLPLLVPYAAFLVVLGYLASKGKGFQWYLIADRNVGPFALGCSIAASFAGLFPIVRQYVTQGCFGATMDIENTKIREYFPAVLIQKGIAEYLARMFAELAAKHAAITNWCKKVSAQTKTTWRFKRIDQVVFGPGNFPTFADLLAAVDARNTAAAATPL